VIKSKSEWLIEGLEISAIRRKYDVFYDLLLA
jgi:hypothetical protein